MADQFTRIHEHHYGRIVVGAGLAPTANIIIIFGLSLRFVDINKPSFFRCIAVGAGLAPALLAKVNRAEFSFFTYCVWWFVLDLCIWDRGLIQNV